MTGLGNRLVVSELSTSAPDHQRCTAHSHRLETREVQLSDRTIAAQYTVHEGSRRSTCSLRPLKLEQALRHMWTPQHMCTGARPVRLGPCMRWPIASLMHGWRPNSGKLRCSGHFGRGCVADCSKELLLRDPANRINVSNHVSGAK